MTSRVIFPCGATIDTKRFAMKTIQAICALLDIDMAHPKAETIALRRLEQLAIHGDKCPRCDGEGATFRGKQNGIQCFPCRGAGYVGFSLSRSALKQLKAANAGGQLEGFRDLWTVQADITRQLKDFDQMIDQAGVHKAYSGFWAERERDGDWNHDMQAIHQQIKLVRDQLFTTVNVDDLVNQSPKTRKRLTSFFNERHRIACQNIDSLLCEVDMYKAWHAKPDFKAMCLSMARNGTADVVLA